MLGSEGNEFTFAELRRFGARLRGHRLQSGACAATCRTVSRPSACFAWPVNDESRFPSFHVRLSCPISGFSASRTSLAYAGPRAHAAALAPHHPLPRFLTTRTTLHVEG